MLILPATTSSSQARSQLNRGQTLVSRLDEALASIVDVDDYIDLPEMSNGLAAAGIVALLFDQNLATPRGLPQEWRDAVVLVPTDSLRTRAARVLTRAFEPANNEWYELWDESQMLDEQVASPIVV